MRCPVPWGFSHRSGARWYEGSALPDSEHTDECPKGAPGLKGGIEGGASEEGWAIEGPRARCTGHCHSSDCYSPHLASTCFMLLTFRVCAALAALELAPGAPAGLSEGGGVADFAPCPVIMPVISTVCPT